MRILLTGATGFVGKAFAKSLGDDYEVVYLGRSKLDDDMLLSSTFVPVDLSVTQEVEAAASTISGDFDVVVHLAAYVPRVASDDLLVDAHSVNVLGTINILEAFKGRFRKLIIGSTLEVYNQAEIKDVVDENSPVGANSYYGSTKLASELIVHNNKLLFPWQFQFQLYFLVKL